MKKNYSKKLVLRALSALCMGGFALSSFGAAFPQTPEKFQVTTPQDIVKVSESLAYAVPQVGKITMGVETGDPALGRIQVIWTGSLISKRDVLFLIPIQATWTLQDIKFSLPAIGKELPARLIQSIKVSDRGDRVVRLCIARFTEDQVVDGITPFDLNKSGDIPPVGAVASANTYLIGQEGTVSPNASAGTLRFKVSDRGEPYPGDRYYISELQASMDTKRPCTLDNQDNGAPLFVAGSADNKNAHVLYGVGLAMTDIVGATANHTDNLTAPFVRIDAFHDFIQAAIAQEGW